MDAKNQQDRAKMVEEAVGRMCRLGMMPHTQGRGLFTMQFDHYEEVPKSIAEKVTGSRKSE